VIQQKARRTHRTYSNELKLRVQISFKQEFEHQKIKFKATDDGAYRAALKMTRRLFVQKEGPDRMNVKSWIDTWIKRGHVFDMRKVKGVIRGNISYEKIVPAILKHLPKALFNYKGTSFSKAKIYNEIMINLL